MDALGKRDVVLFLGAGFSAEAGFYIMSEFGKRAAEELHHFSTDPSDSPSRKSSVKVLLDAFQKHAEFQDFLKEKPSLTDFNIQNMEDIFCLAEIFRQSKINKVNLKSGPYDIHALLEKIQLCIWKIYHEYPPKNNRKKIDIKPYAQFVDILKKPELNRRASVITTNYDLLVETVAWEGKLKMSYFLDSMLTPLRLFPSNPIYIEQVVADDFMPLIKLHGSVNFFKKNDGSYGISDDIALQNQRVGGSIIPSDRPAIFALDFLNTIMGISGTRLTPSLIPPTYSKLDQIEWLQNFWHCGIKLLSQAKKIIFIGYSMPSSDGFMKSLFNAAMAVRTISEKPQIYLVKRLRDGIKKTDDPVFLRFKTFFKDLFKEENFISKKFSEASLDGDIEKIL